MATRHGMDAARAILSRRLRNQALDRPSFTKPAEVVAWHGAIQAQEHGPARLVEAGAERLSVFLGRRVDVTIGRKR